MALKSRHGFTIVELAIVIVVVAILATVVAVGYSAVIADTDEASLGADLAAATAKLKSGKMELGGFPAVKPDFIAEELSYVGNDGGFCVSGNVNGKTFHAVEMYDMKEGDCGSLFDTAIIPIQNVTPAQCAVLPVFTGTNTAAVRTVTDARGGTTRTYEIAKLADNKCWMLTNLKLGSTSGTTLLRPSDSNVASYFTLPQLTALSVMEADSPRVYGPAPGDTGSGATNYGYFYNWSAATAGESRTSHPQTAGSAPHSICPAGWRLPTGGSTGEFAWLNAKMNNPSATAPSASSGTGYYQNWQFSGPLRGVFSGYRASGFSGQGGVSYLWSSSAYPDYSYNAFYASFSSGHVLPGGSYGGRDLGYGVRCLLNQNKTISTPG